jgi:NAD(P)-dependent dehydrogenase (short-subunit alcohol dehydrogenase family)
VSAGIEPTKLLRPGVLDGVCVLVADARALVGREDEPGAGDGRDGRSFAQALETSCAALGAQVRAWSRDETSDANADLLAIDAGGAFALEDARSGQLASAAEGSDRVDASRAALAACLDSAWEATSRVANAAFIESGRGGRIVFVAPAVSAPASVSADGRRGAQLRDAARAGLENLARTLSIEWARYGITTVTIAPAEGTPVDELAALVAYLASPAGAYFSGCLLDLRGGGLLDPRAVARST